MTNQDGRIKDGQIQDGHKIQNGRKIQYGRKIQNAIMYVTIGGILTKFQTYDKPRSTNPRWSNPRWPPNPK